jgi:hypothetical protein
VTVTGERRRAVAIGWRYLVSAIALVAAAALVVGSLSSGGGRSRSAHTRAAPRTAQSTQVRSVAPTSASSCVDAAGYGGLGGRISAFDANNNNSVGPAGPSPGAAFYVVTATVRGCVAGFAVQDTTGPPITAPELLILVSHPYLPGDAKPLLSTDRCAVWESAALKRATGRAFARATAIAQTASAAGRAQIEATSSSTCQRLSRPLGVLAPTRGRAAREGLERSRTLEPGR